MTEAWGAGCGTGSVVQSTARVALTIEEEQWDDVQKKWSRETYDS